MKFKDLAKAEHLNLTHEVLSHHFPIVDHDENGRYYLGKMGQPLDDSSLRSDIKSIGWTEKSHKEVSPRIAPGHKQNLTVYKHPEHSGLLRLNHYIRPNQHDDDAVSHTASIRT